MMRDLAALFCACFVALPAAAGYVDVHVHPVPIGPGAAITSSLSEELGVMEEAGIVAMILLPTPQVNGSRAPWDYETFSGAMREAPGRFAFLGGGGNLNPMIHETAVDRVSESVRRRFSERAQRILADGAAGFGEMGIHHLSFTSGHPYESVPADHPLFLLLADIAAEAHVVIDVHFDPVAEDMAMPENLRGGENPERLVSNLAAFERFLDHEPKARIVWAHAGADPLGQWTPELSRKLLAKHPNLFMSIRLAGPNSPMRNPMLTRGDISPDWLALLNEFPDRFVMGGDQFFLSAAGRGGPAMMFANRAAGQRRLQSVLLSRLPTVIARKVGCENAVLLYKLKIDCTK